MTNAEHFTGKVAVKALITKEGKILITRSKGDTLWDFPGGRIDTWESLEDAVMREMREEIGAEVRIEKMLCSEQSLHRKDNASILFVTFLVALVHPDQLFTNHDDEAEETKWISRDDYDPTILFNQCAKPLKTFWNID